jgi:hypothetical protein
VNAFYVLVAGWMIVGLVRVGRVPKNYVHPGKLPIVAVWNVFDETRFTQEGIEYHRRVIRFMGQTLVVFVVALILKAIFPAA